MLAALIATHPNPMQLRTQWAVMQQVSSAEIGPAFADHPDFPQMVPRADGVLAGCLAVGVRCTQARH
jgi:hypothetical protein